jgi:UDP-N-acetylmuramoylalanine-D-glutamate ligase
MTTSIGTDTRAAVFGYGIEGRSAFAWLRRRGCRDVRVISSARPEDLDPGVPWVAEADIERALSGVDLLIKSRSGRRIRCSPRRRPRRADTSATVLFVERARRRLALIGSRAAGKSTTATLITDARPRRSRRSVGNIRLRLDVVGRVSTGP